MTIKKTLLITLFTISILTLSSCDKEFKLNVESMEVLDIANNVISKEYTPTLLKHLQSLRTYSIQPEYPLRIYAASEFQDGALLLISLQGIDDLQLIYLYDEGYMATIDYPRATFHYTYLMGHTIHFGLMYPGYDDEASSKDFSHKIDASFSNGENLSHESSPTYHPDAPNGVYAGGYIFINTGIVWLNEFAFYDSNGNLDMDTSGIIATSSNSWSKLYTEDTDARLKVANAVYDLNLSPSLIETRYYQIVNYNRKDTLNPDISVSLTSSNSSVNLKGYLSTDTENMDIRFMWMQSGSLENIQDIEANAEVGYAIHDFSKARKEPPGGRFVTGELIAEVAVVNVCWIRLSQSDIRDPSIKNSLFKSARVPAEEGLYCLYIDYEGWYHFAVVRVVK